MSLYPHPRVPPPISDSAWFLLDSPYLYPAASPTAPSQSAASLPAAPDQSVAPRVRDLLKQLKQKYDCYRPYCASALKCSRRGGIFLQLRHPHSLGSMAVGYRPALNSSVYEFFVAELVDELTPRFVIAELGDVDVQIDARSQTKDWREVETVLKRLNASDGPLQRYYDAVWQSHQAKEREAARLKQQMDHAMNQLRADYDAKVVYFESKLKRTPKGAISLQLQDPTSSLQPQFVHMGYRPTQDSPAVDEFYVAWLRNASSAKFLVAATPNGTVADSGRLTSDFKLILPVLEALNQPDSFLRNYYARAERRWQCEQAARAQAEQAARAQAEQAAREQAAREQAARAQAEQAAREQAARAQAEQAAREQAAREQAARAQAEQAAREQAARAQAAREQAVREQAARAQAEQAARAQAEQAARAQAEQAAREQAARAQAEQAARAQAAQSAPTVDEEAWVTDYDDSDNGAEVSYSDDVSYSTHAANAALFAVPVASAPTYAATVPAALSVEQQLKQQLQRLQNMFDSIPAGQKIEGNRICITGEAREYVELSYGRSGNFIMDYKQGEHHVFKIKNAAHRPAITADSMSQQAVLAQLNMLCFVDGGLVKRYFDDNAPVAAANSALAVPAC